MPKPEVYIAEYLAHIARNDAACKAFKDKSKRGAAMDAFGLTQAQKDALTSDNANALGDAIIAELSGTAAMVINSMTTKLTL
jgi:hypothetical protein